MCKIFVDSLRTTLQWDKLNFCTLPHQGRGKLVSLRTLCRYSMVEAATRSMFGSHLHAILPNVVDQMLQFNDNAWMVFFRYPDTFGSPVSAPRKALTKALEEFCRLPQHQRREQAWSIKTITRAQEIVGIDVHSRASIMLMIYWA